MIPYIEDETERGEWQINHNDPRKRENCAPHTLGPNPATWEAETEAYQLWLRKHVAGPPQATFAYSVEELQSMGIVGLYLPHRAPLASISPRFERRFIGNVMPMTLGQTIKLWFRGGGWKTEKFVFEEVFPKDPRYETALYVEALIYLSPPQNP